MGTMIAGRIIAGVGVGANTSTVPIWVAEISQPESRGKNIATQLFIVNFGFMTVYWFTYGMSFVKGEVSFRLPIAGQCFFMVLALPLLYYLPETPRVLFKWGKIEEGTRLLARFVGLLHLASRCLPGVLTYSQADTTVDDERIVAAKVEILEAIEAESTKHTNPLAVLFWDKSEIKFRRRAVITLIVFLLQQFGGCTFVAVSKVSSMHREVRAYIMSAIVLRPHYFRHIDRSE